MNTYKEKIMEFTSYKRLREVREALHLSQNEIAALLQTTRQQIGKWENGVQLMGIDKYMTLAEYYNVSIDYLCGLIDTPKKLR